MTATSLQSQQRESIGEKFFALSKPRIIIKPIPHSNEIPVPVFKGMPEFELSGSEQYLFSFHPLTALKLQFL